MILSKKLFPNSQAGEKQTNLGWQRFADANRIVVGPLDYGSRAT